MRTEYHRRRNSNNLTKTSFVIKSSAVLSNEPRNETTPDKGNHRKIMNGILDARIVHLIVDALTPGIQATLALYNRKYFHLVVLNPHEEGDVFFNAPIAGPVTEYPKPYDEIAMLKATVSRRTKMDTIDLLTSEPALLVEEDVIFQGGVYYRGIPIGGSGAPAPEDHAICVSVGAHLTSYCQMAVQEMQATAQKGGHFKIPAIVPKVFS